MKEFRVDEQTLAGGSAWDLVLDMAEFPHFCGGRSNGQVSVLAREDGKVLEKATGRQPGKVPWRGAIDSKGTLWHGRGGLRPEGRARGGTGAVR